MADIPFPDSDNSPFDVGGFIEATMAAKRLPIEADKKEIDDYNEEKELWLSIKAKINQLEDLSRSLYNYENPFAERETTSSDENIVTASAVRNAPPGENQVRVISLANRDRLRSKELPKEFKVAAGEYRFKVGEEEVKISFKGGTVKAFASAISKKGEELIKARVISSRTGTDVFLIESVKMGASNKLVFEGLAQQWALDNELIKPSEGEDLSPVSLSEELLVPWEGGPLESNLIEIRGEEELVLEPYSRFQLNLPPPKKKNRLLQFRVKTELLDENYYSEPDLKSLVDTNRSANFDRRTEIESQENQFSENFVKSLDTPLPYETEAIFYAQVEGSEPIILGNLPAAGQEKIFTTEKIPESQVIKALLVNNDNPYLRIFIENLHYADRETEGFDPVNPISEASDAEVEIDGIPLYRDKNEVEDFIEGVSFSLKNAKPDETVTIKVEPDTEVIKNKLGEFIFYYNQVVQDSLIFTTSDPAIIDELDYLDEEQKKIAKEKQQAGLLRNENLLIQLRSRLNQISQAPYSGGSSFQLLAEVGIFTNPLTATGNIPSVSQRRGYLQYDEDILDKSLSENLEGVKDLFGNDTTGNNQVDDGIGFQLVNMLREYSRTGGFIEGKTKNLDTLVRDTQKGIERAEGRLAQQETSLRREFGNMQTTIDSLSSQQKTFDAYNKKP